MSQRTFESKPTHTSSCMIKFRLLHAHTMPLQHSLAHSNTLKGHGLGGELA